MNKREFFEKYNEFVRCKSERTYEENLAVLADLKLTAEAEYEVHQIRYKNALWTVIGQSVAIYGIWKLVCWIVL